MSRLNEVVEKLNSSGVTYGVLQVEAENLSVDAHVKALGMKYTEGLATLIYKADDNFVALLRRDDRNVDLKRFKKFLNVKDLRFANEDELASLGFEVGLASPILLQGIKVYADEKLKEMERVVCGSTDRNQSIEINAKDLIEIVKPEFIDITIPNLKRQNTGKQRILTGDRPTGRMHIGHLVGSLRNRVKLQDEYEQFVMIANVQALTDSFDNPEKVKESILELLCDYYAVGIDFDKTTVFIQSEVPEIHEIFIYLANFVTIQQISHNPTIKTEIAQKGFENSTPLGFFIYPVHQVADILCVNANLVPVGRDQAPMIEGARNIARRFNNTYNAQVLNEPEAMFGMEKNLPGIDGNAKMGKSLGNCIYLSDSEEELREKVFKIITDPNRIHATDPGTVEGNTVFIYHEIFNANIKEVEDLKNRYRAGTVGDVEVKEKLFVAMNNVLAPIRERRKEAEAKKLELLAKALSGSRRVSEIAKVVLSQMKVAMEINYKPVK